MKKDQNLTKPLSEDEIDWLSDFLWDAQEEYEDCMSLETVDGLFAALAVSPKFLPPSEWLGVIFGEEHEFQSDKETDKVISLLFRHWNNVNNLIQNRPESPEDDIYIPLVFGYEEDEELAKEWAIGFHVGIGYCQKEWEKAVEKDEDLAQLLGIIFVLEAGYDLENEENVFSHEKLKELFVMLPVVSYSLYEYWHGNENTNISHSTTSHKSNKIGRNEPCPCGSGKKYKKCCGNSLYESTTIH